MLFSWTRSSFVGMSVIMALALSACGQPTDAGGGSPPVAGDSAIDWDRPLPGGIVTLSVSDQQLAFAPLEPKGLGEPESIFATSEEHAEISLREIVWRYSSPDLGTFLVWERLTNGSGAMDEWMEMVSQEPGCATHAPSAEDEEKFGAGAGATVDCSYGSRSFVTIRDGKKAFLFDGPQYATIHWLEPFSPPNAEARSAVEAQFRDPKLEVFVLGPALTVEQALVIAERL